MKHQFLPLILLASSIPALAQVPENSASIVPDAAQSPSAPAGGGAGATTNTAPREIVTPSTPSPPGGPVSLASINDRFSRLDTNHNGFLSPEEINLLSRSDTISSSAARFRQMDTNHDGRISVAEYNPLSSTPPNAAPGTAPASVSPASRN